jgi:transcriptional regulator with XRE-family HTH domain
LGYYKIDYITNFGICQAILGYYLGTIKKDIYMSKNIFGKRLKRLRQERELSQIQLAKLLNCVQTKISKLELNVLEPDLETLEKLSILFEVTTDYLIGISDDITAYNGKKKKTDYEYKYEYKDDYAKVKHTTSQPKKINNKKIQK